jgi:hypothetical protein
MIQKSSNTTEVYRDGESLQVGRLPFLGESRRNADAAEMRMGKWSMSPVDVDW